MGSSTVVGLRSVALGVADIERSSHFYETVWGLVPVARHDEKRYLRARGAEHHAVCLVPRDSPQFVAVTLAAPDAAAIDSLYAAALRTNVGVAHVPRELPAAAGGGYGLSLIGPEDLRVDVSCDVARHDGDGDGDGDGSLPKALTHVVVNTSDMPAQLNFFQTFLGFQCSDTTAIMTFLRCGADHHTIALARCDHLTLNHAAFEMHDMDALMYGAGRLIEHGYEIEWGPGRHGPGSNVFAYFIDPEGFVVEYTTEMDQVDASYVANDAAYWSSFPKRPCRWGVARKPSARLMEAMAGKLVGTMAVR